MDYYPWCDDQYDDSLAWITDEPEAFGNDGFRLKKGEPCAAWVPPDLVFDLSKQHGVKLSDAIPNSLALQVVSEKLRGLLEKLAPQARIEFLPARLRTQKKKLLPAKYFVANFLDVVPCTDMKRSDYRMDAIRKTQVGRFRRLVLDQKKVPKDAKVFRLGERTRLVIVRGDLGQSIVDADCTGMFFMNMDEYGKEFR